ncbi:hypothetical protein M231_06002 [Tremella mesenterica]|uniref:Uncharacterized protein n=1 Tax=Tremella mesenterica TaxID=5217 RepID=A0A4Q1BGK0_TREME|nr:hypothetical protein M231_06002 [Tremella mesenterica]
MAADQASVSGVASADHGHIKTDHEIVVDLSQSPAATPKKRPAEEPLFLSTEDEESSTPVTVKRRRIDLMNPSLRPIPLKSKLHSAAPLHTATVTETSSPSRPIVPAERTPTSPTIDVETVTWARNNTKAGFLSRAGGNIVAARLQKRDLSKLKPVLETQDPLPGQPTQDELVTHMMTHPDILKAWRAKKEKK